MILPLMAIVLFVVGVVVHKVHRSAGFYLMLAAIACGAAFSFGGV